jgi:ribosomal 30S subunit maturation factor RimM
MKRQTKEAKEAQKRALEEAKEAERIKAAQSQKRISGFFAAVPKKESNEPKPGTFYYYDRDNNGSR